jgi:hypothetical protein
MRWWTLSKANECGTRVPVSGLFLMDGDDGAFRSNFGVLAAGTTVSTAGRADTPAASLGLPYGQEPR